MTKCTHDRTNYSLGNVREGACPRCEKQLERHEGDHGRCPCCRNCWKARGADIALVIHPVSFADRGPFKFTDGRVELHRDG